MDIVIYSCLFSIIGSFIGVVISIFVGRKNIYSCLAFSSSVMIVMIFSSIAIEALSIQRSISTTIIYIISILCGFFLIMLIDVSISEKKRKTQKDSYVVLGIILTVAICLHNFPEGLIVGASGRYNTQLTIKMGLLLAMHDIPEAICISVPFIKEKKSFKCILLVIFIIIINNSFTIFGALIGYMITSISKFIILAYGIATGAMIYVVFLDMLPKIYEKKCNFFVYFWLLLGFIIGLVLISM